jgi:hypothetical protein
MVVPSSIHRNNTGGYTSSTATSNKPCTVYQVDSSATATFRRMISSTTRKAFWIVGRGVNTGISSRHHQEHEIQTKETNGVKQLLRAGDHSNGCIEHENIMFLWDLASGKTRIFHNLSQIHCSHFGRHGDCSPQEKFQFTWSRQMNTFTLIAYAYPPLSKSRATRKQFDLIIDGISFDSLPKPCYELGNCWMADIKRNKNTSSKFKNMLPVKTVAAVPRKNKDDEDDAMDARANTKSVQKRRSPLDPQHQHEEEVFSRRILQEKDSKGDSGCSPCALPLFITFK